MDITANGKFERFTYVLNRIQSVLDDGHPAAGKFDLSSLPVMFMEALGDLSREDAVASTLGSLAFELLFSEEKELSSAYIAVMNANLGARWNPDEQRYEPLFELVPQDTIDRLLDDFDPEELERAGEIYHTVSARVTGFVLGIDDIFDQPDHLKLL